MSMFYPTLKAYRKIRALSFYSTTGIEQTRSSMMANEKSLTIDINNIWAVSIQKKLDVAEQTQMSHPFTIYQVPSRIQGDRAVYYQPSFVAIGPYHRGKKHLRGMEEHKWRYLRDFLARNNENSLQMYLYELQKLESLARACYFEDIDLSSKEFVEMMLLDGCFIIGFFLHCNKKCDNDQPTSCIHLSGVFRREIIDDLVLLENQIPFFIIQSLFDLLMGYNNDNKDEQQRGLSIVEMAAQTLLEEPCDLVLNDEFRLTSHELDHLLHLYHHFMRPKLEFSHSSLKHSHSFVGMLKKQLQICFSYCQLRRNASHQQTTNRVSIPCASKLVEAGVKLKNKTRTTRSRGSINIDISFHDGILSIPVFVMDRLDVTCFINLVAFEKCKFLKTRPLTAYSQFMSCVIETPRDVQILRECGIIESWLQNEEIVLFFKRLSDYAFLPEPHLFPLYVEVNHFCTLKWNKWRAKLIRDYFSSPWALLSLFAAVIILIFTFLQAFFAMYSYYHPST